MTENQARDCFYMALNSDKVLKAEREKNIDCIRLYIEHAFLNEMKLIDNKKPEPEHCKHGILKELHCKKFDNHKLFQMIDNEIFRECLQQLPSDCYLENVDYIHAVNCRCEIKPMELRNKHDRYKQSIYNKCYRVDEY